MRIFKIFVLLLIIFFLPEMAFSASGPRFIVTFKDEFSDSSALSNLKRDYFATSESEKPIHSIADISFPIGISTDAALEELKFDSRIEYVEIDYIVTVNTIPNDKLFAKQWAINSHGYGENDISAQKAWLLSKGSKRVIIAILDTGIDYRHPDLAKNIWCNPNEIPGNGVDDDGNGFIDDIHGWDFVNDDSDPIDGNFHGTFMAGIIGAVHNNNEGICGIMPNVSMMAVKGLSDKGWGFSSDLAKGIYYAVDNGATAINASWGGGGYSTATKNAIDYAAAHNVIFCAAAGNRGTNNDEIPYFPANYDCDNIIVSGASDIYDRPTWFSQWGKESVDLFAPGTDVVSTALYGSYRFAEGTSVSNPHTTAAIGMITAISSEMNFRDKKKIILQTVDKCELLNEVSLSGGRLNLFSALNYVRYHYNNNETAKLIFAKYMNVRKKKGGSNE